MRLKKTACIVLLFISTSILISPLLSKSETGNKYEYNVANNDLFGYHIAINDGSLTTYSYEAMNIKSYDPKPLSTKIKYDLYTRQTHDTIDNSSFESYAPIGGGNWNGWVGQKNQQITINSDAIALNFDRFVPIGFPLSSYWNESLIPTLRDKIIENHFQTYSTFEDYIKGKLGERDNNYNTDPDYISELVTNGTENTICENEHWNMFIYYGNTELSIINDYENERAVFVLNLELEKCYNSENKMTYFRMKFNSNYFAEMGKMNDGVWCPEGSPYVDQEDIFNEIEKYLVYDNRPAPHPYLEELSVPLSVNMEYNIQEGDELHYNVESINGYNTSFLNVTSASLMEINKENEFYTFITIYDKDYVRHITNEDKESYLIQIINRHEPTECYEFVSSTDFHYFDINVMFTNCLYTGGDITETNFSNAESNPDEYAVSIYFIQDNINNNKEYYRLYFNDVIYHDNDTTTIITKSKTYDEIEMNQRFNPIDWDTMDNETYQIENNISSILEFMYVLPNDIVVKDWVTENLLRVFIMNDNLGIFEYVKHDPIDVRIGEMNMVVLEPSRGQYSVTDISKAPTKNIISDRHTEFNYDIIMKADNITVEDMNVHFRCNLSFNMNMDYDVSNTLNRLDVNYNTRIELFNVTTNKICASLEQVSNLTKNRTYLPTFNVTFETLGLNLITEIDISDYENINLIVINWDDNSNSTYTPIITKNKYVSIHQYNNSGNYTIAIRLYDNDTNIVASYVSEEFAINRLQSPLSINYTIGSEIIYKHENSTDISYTKIKVMSIENITVGESIIMNVTYNSYSWEPHGKTWEPLELNMGYSVDSELTNITSLNNLLFKPTNITNEQWELYLKILSITADDLIIDYDNFTANFNGNVFQLQTSRFQPPDWVNIEYEIQWDNESLMKSFRYTENGETSSLDIIPIKMNLISHGSNFTYIKNDTANVSFSIEATNWTYVIKQNGTDIEYGENSIPFINFSLLDVGVYNYEVIVTDVFGRSLSESFEVVILSENGSEPPPTGGDGDEPPSGGDDEPPSGDGDEPPAGDDNKTPSNDEPSDTKPFGWVISISFIGFISGGVWYYLAKHRSRNRFNFRNIYSYDSEFCKLNPDHPFCLK